MCQGRASFPRPFSIPGAVLYSVLCSVSVSYLPTQNATQDKCTRDWETGSSSTQPYPAGRVISTKTRPPEPKVYPARNPQTSCSEQKGAPLHQVCLDGFHGTRRGPHKRNTVCNGAYAPKLPALLVESRAAPIKARTGRVAKH